MSLHVPGVRRQHPLWHVCRSSYELMCQASQMVVTRFHTCRYSRVILHWLKGKVNSLVHLTQTVKGQNHFEGLRCICHCICAFRLASGYSLGKYLGIYAKLRSALKTEIQ